MRYLKSQGTLWTLMAVALAMRLLGPMGWGLGYDEISMLVDRGRTSFGGLFVGEGGNHHYPLQSVLAWMSLNALGESAFALRLPALLFGVGAIGAMLRLSIRVARRRVAMLSTLLLLLSYHEVWFSQNASGYAGLLCLSLIATLFFVRCLDEDGLEHCVGAGVCLALASYIHISGVFVILAHGIAAMVWALRSWKSLGHWPARLPQPLMGVGIGLALTGLLYSPMLPEALTFFSPVGAAGALVPAWRSFPVWPFVLSHLEQGAAQGIEWSHVVQVGLGVFIGLAVCVCGLMSYLKERLEIGLLWVLPGVLGSCVLGLLGRELWSGFLFSQLGFLLLCLARGLSVIATWLGAQRGFAQRQRAERLWFAMGSSFVLLASMAVLPGVYQRPQQDFEGALAFVHGQRSAGGAVVTVGLTQMPYASYFHTDFSPVGTLPELLAVDSRSASVIVLRTSSDFLSVSRKALSAHLNLHGEEMARFPGTRVGGDLIVLRVDQAATEPGGKRVH